MPVRQNNLEALTPLIATFKISQTASVDDLKDADIGKAVTMSANLTVSPCADNSVVVGKLLALTLTDADNGKRVASVQIGGVCRFLITGTAPALNNRILGATGGKVKQAPVLAAFDPAGGNIARGTVIEVNGSTDCLVILN